jgi:hypothetical protein
MEPSIFTSTADHLKEMGFVRSDREFSRKLGMHELWTYKLRKLAPHPEQRVRQGAVMRLRSHLMKWKDAAARPVADRLAKLIDAVDEADTRARFIAHGR